MAIHSAIFLLQLSTTYISHVQLRNCATTGKLYTVSCICISQNASYTKILAMVDFEVFTFLPCLANGWIASGKIKSQGSKQAPCKVKTSDCKTTPKSSINSRHFQGQVPRSRTQAFQVLLEWSKVELLIEGFNRQRIFWQVLDVDVG